MTEQYVLDQLVLNGVNYHKYGLKQFEEGFTFYMHQLQRVMGYETIEQACEHFGQYGERLEQQYNQSQSEVA